MFYGLAFYSGCFFLVVCVLLICCLICVIWGCFDWIRVWVWLLALKWVVVLTFAMNWFGGLCDCLFTFCYSVWCMNICDYDLELELLCFDVDV